MGSLRIEKQITAAMLKIPNTMKRVSQSRLEPKHFEDEKAQEIVRICLDLYRRGLEVNAENVRSVVSRSQDLEAGAKSVLYSYVDSLVHLEVDSQHFALDTMQSMRRDSEFLSMMKSAAEAKKRGEAQEAIEIIKESIRNIDITEGYDLSEYTAEGAYQKRDEERRKIDLGEGALKIQDEFNYLKKYFPRGLGRGTITAIGGTTGIGKSLYMANVIRLAMKQGLNILYVIAENQKIQAESRLDSIISGIDYEDLYRGAKDGTFENKLQSYGSRTFTVKFSMGGFCSDDISAIIDDIALQKVAIDIIFIDSPDHMNPSVPSREYWVKKTNVYEDLKAIVDEYSIPMVVTLPMKASAANAKMVSAEDTGGAYNIAKICDNLIFFLKDEQDFMLKRRRMVVTKNRDGTADGEIISLKLGDDVVFRPYEESLEDVQDMRITRV